MYTLHDIYFLIPFIVGAFAQIVKVMIDSYCGKRITFRSLLSSGGMPSAHTTLTSSLLTMVVLFEGMFTTITMIVGVFSVLIWYDAANVRYESGKHAQYINTLKDEMHKVMTHEHLSEKPHFLGFGLLRERLGHTPVEISVGILFGIFITIGFVLLCDMYIISF